MHLRRLWFSWSVVWCGRSTAEALVTNHPAWVTCTGCLEAWGREKAN
jgi:hypothetical protein